MTTPRRHEQQTGTYRALIGIAEEVVGNARAALGKTRKMRGRDMLPDMAIDELRKQIERFCELGSCVIDQARRRVLEGEQVPNEKKIYSIFEPHTDHIKRGKVRTPIEFGHKVFLAESAQGLITQYEVLKGNPCDEVHVAPSHRRHKQTFGRVPVVRHRSRLLQRTKLGLVPARRQPPARSRSSCRVPACPTLQPPLL
jgi:IS5 family transposase